MLAPRPVSVRLLHHRVRCACGSETLLFFPDGWYVGQRVVTVEPTCRSCGRSVGVLEVPEGARTEVYLLTDAPASRARAVSAELFDEVTASRKEGLVPEPPGGIDADTWTTAHDATPEYQAWLASQPGPVAPPAWLDRVDLAVTAALVFIVAACIVV
jgi:hypothetical protein